MYALCCSAVLLLPVVSKHLRNPPERRAGSPYSRLHLGLDYPWIVRCLRFAVCWLNRSIDLVSLRTPNGTVYQVRTMYVVSCSTLEESLKLSVAYVAQAARRGAQ